MNAHFPSTGTTLYYRFTCPVNCQSPATLRLTVNDISSRQPLVSSRSITKACDKIQCYLAVKQKLNVMSFESPNRHLSIKETHESWWTLAATRAGTDMTSGISCSFKPDFSGLQTFDWNFTKMQMRGHRKLVTSQRSLWALVRPSHVHWPGSYQILCLWRMTLKVKEPCRPLTTKPFIFFSKFSRNQNMWEYYCIPLTLAKVSWSFLAYNTVHCPQPVYLASLLPQWSTVS